MRWRTYACVVTLLACLCVLPALAKKKPPASPINLNTATSAQLQEVPGIGPATADKILQMRKSYGAFKSVDDLLAVRGIGAKRLDKMRKYLIVAKTPDSLAAAGKKSTAVPPAAKKPPPSAGSAKPASSAASKPAATAPKPAPESEEPEEPS
jgi:comEA protein